jgi:hypothetical protein
MKALPEIAIDPLLKRGIDAVAAAFASVEEAEAVALTDDIARPLRGDQDWTTFRDSVIGKMSESGYVVVRGLEADEGRSLLIVSAALDARFDTYRPGRIVKRFRMSPWTNELSHTTRAGDFHTDGNVSVTPPVATAMQCEHEDPGAPEYAEQRVAFLPDVLERLASGGTNEVDAMAFLIASGTVMAHERSAEVWRGPLVENDTIRYHPHSLRIAAARLGAGAPNLEPVIGAVHRVAMDVSVPFHTAAGDAVLVSNRTALHYRGACSVRFTRFPSEFESRSLFVLHLNERTT